LTKTCLKELKELLNILKNITRSQRDIIIFTFLVAAVILVYGQVQHHDFLSYDDKAYVTQNPYVKNGWSLDGLKWALTSRHHSHWHPLTWLSHMTDCQLFGLHPGWHHLSNLFLHVMNTLLLFFVLKKMTGAAFKSAFVAALFALHPLHVETVAWVADRKDLLCGFFWLMTLWGYCFYTERSSIRRYFLVFGLFVCALMAKPMAISLPIILLLLDYWPMNRFVLKNHMEKQDLNQTNRRAFERLILEKVGFFVLVGISASITVLSMKKGHAVNLFKLIPDAQTLARAMVHYGIYIHKTFWPAGLAVPYSLVRSYSHWQILGSAVLFFGTSLFVCLKAKRYPYLPVGWLWFIITLLPVIGIIKFGPQKVADRYTYLPLVGLFIMVAWGIPDAIKKWPHRRWAVILSSASAVAVLMACSWAQVGQWKDSESLFLHAIRFTEGNFKTHTNLGVILVEKGEYGRATHHFGEAINIKPDYVEAYNNMGIVLRITGRVEEAKAYYHKALQISPKFSKAHYNLGVAFEGEGRLEDALHHYGEAVKRNPKYAAAYNNIGAILANRGDYAEAVRYFSKVLKLQPDNKNARKNFRNARRLMKLQKN
jgi:protein O-mannosyl-transferase